MSRSNSGTWDRKNKTRTNLTSTGKVVGNLSYYKCKRDKKPKSKAAFLKREKATHRGAQPGRVPTGLCPPMGCITMHRNICTTLNMSMLSIGYTTCTRIVHQM